LRILVTGGAGFIGSHIVDLLIEKGFTVAVVDDLSHGKKENVNKKAIFFHEDIKSTRLKRIFSQFKPGVVNHHAALVNVPESQKHPLKDVGTNVVGTLKLLEASKEAGIKQFIFASSVAVYGGIDNLPIKETEPLQPISIYGVSKAIAESYVRLYMDSFIPTVFRYANVYGPRQDGSAEGGVVAIFLQQLKNNQPGTIFGNGQQTRDFIHVSDVIRANYAALKQPRAGVYHVSTGKETSVRHLYKLCEQVTEKKLAPRLASVRPGDIHRSVLSNKKTQDTFTWKPRQTLENGLKETWESFL